MGDPRPPQPALTVVVPTRDRRQILLETLERVGEQAVGEDVDLIVVDDGSVDGSASAAADWARSSGVSLEVLNGAGTGPAAARNLAIERARAVCLFLDDDVRPGPGMLARHLEFHRRHPDPNEALIGRVVPAPEFDTELARWAHERGALFAFGSLSAGEPVPPSHFWSAQASVKTALARDAGGFDPALRFFEDVELAHRLTVAGMRLRYDPEAVGEHQQQVTLEGLMARARESGPYFQPLAERVLGTALPRPPGARHRVKSAALTALNSMRVRPAAVRHATWRFLLDEAQRESLHDGNQGELRIGSALARLAASFSTRQQALARSRS